MANCVFPPVADGCITEPLVDEEAQERNTSNSENLKACNAGRSKCYDWRSTAIILGFVFFESLCFYGIATNLVIYLTNVIHESNTAATTIVANWSGTNFLTPLLAALLADSYLGNYKTILFSSIIYIIGTLTVTLSAIIQLSKTSICKECPTSTGPQKQMLFLGLYLIVFGSGGVKASLLPLGANQFDDNNPTQQVKIVSFFSWFYFCINLGSLFSCTVVVWIQENVSWSVGYAISSICITLATASFLLGTPTFRLGKLKIDAKEDRGGKFSSSEAGGMYTSPWTLRILTQSVQLKILLGLFPIWLTNILYSVAYAQMYTTFIEQGRVMDRKIGSITIPPASLSAVEVLSIMFCVLLYDKVVVATASRFLGNERGLTHLQRMGVGHLLMILAMAVAASLESNRLQNMAEGKSISILWQLPQFFIVGCSEIFCYAGQLEFFYDQATNSMRSISTAICLLTVAMGNYLNSLMVMVIEHTTRNANSPGWIPDDLNRGRLDKLFWLLAGICFANFMAYLFCASRYIYSS